MKALLAFALLAVFFNPVIAVALVGFVAIALAMRLDRCERAVFGKEWR